MSEDAHNSDNPFDGALWRWYWEIGWEPTPQQIGQPLTPEFSQDDAEFLRSIKVKVEES
jgi:hypothetical protein